MAFQFSAMGSTGLAGSGTQFVPSNAQTQTGPDLEEIETEVGPLVVQSS